MAVAASCCCQTSSVTDTRSAAAHTWTDGSGAAEAFLKPRRCCSCLECFPFFCKAFALVGLSICVMRSLAWLAPTATAARSSACGVITATGTSASCCLLLAMPAWGGLLLMACCFLTMHAVCCALLGTAACQLYHSLVECITVSAYVFRFFFSTKCSLLVLMVCV